MNAYGPVLIYGPEPAWWAVCSLRGAAAEGSLVARDVEAPFATSGTPRWFADAGFPNKSRHGDSVRRGSSQTSTVVNRAFASTTTPSARQ